MGTAMAMATVCVSALSTIINPLAGHFIDTRHSYTEILMVFFALTVFGFLLSVVWNVLDYRRSDGRINASAEQLRVLELMRPSDGLREAEAVPIFPNSLENNLYRGRENATFQHDAPAGGYGAI